MRKYNYESKKGFQLCETLSVKAKREWFSVAIQLTIQIYIETFRLSSFS